MAAGEDTGVEVAVGGLAKVGAGGGVVVRAEVGVGAGSGDCVGVGAVVLRSVGGGRRLVWAKQSWEEAIPRIIPRKANFLKSFDIFMGLSACLGGWLAEVRCGFSHRFR